MTLNPCPFCGGEAKFLILTKALTVTCKNCGATSAKVDCRLIRYNKRKDISLEERYQNTFDNAAYYWNRRA